MTAFMGDGVPCILVIEDIEPQRRLLVHALAGDGYATVTARNGAEAMTVLENETTSIDMVLTAVAMPWLDKLRVYQTVRHRGSAIPVLCVSGVATPELSQELGNDPLVRCLPRPWTVEEVLRVVRALLVASLWGEEYV